MTVAVETSPTAAPIRSRVAPTIPPVIRLISVRRVIRGDVIVRMLPLFVTVVTENCGNWAIDLWY
jgi:hypothetical protein